MTAPSAKRKWLPSDAYRFLVLAALRSKPEGLSKRELAWQTRANHYMITRALRELQGAGHVQIEGLESGYRIRATEAGLRFHERHRDYARQNYGDLLSLHFRYGKRPAWAHFESAGETSA